MGGLLQDSIIDGVEPSPDIAVCSECGWRGSVSECETEKDGDWESGFYDAHLCPKCEDGGCIDDYSMTKEIAAEWVAWKDKKKPPFPRAI